MLFAVSLLARADAFAQSATQADAAARPTVATKLGQLQGEMQDGTRVFRGIPYAAAPVGDLRWQPPQRAKAWEGVRDASKFGPNCPTPAGVGRNNGKGEKAVHGPGYDAWFAKMEKGSSEDCLTLNVWAPNPAPRNAAVMVFFSPTSSGSVPLFDGGTFAKDGVIFVAPNNRMFTQSMFAHPALRQAALPGKPHTKLHELDRIAALEWVRDNIRAFGGDPRNVTIFGQSNSAASILALMSTRKAKGLFQRAIVQSGSSRTAPISPEGLEKIGIELATLAGLDGANATAEQLRALPLDAFPFFVGTTADESLHAANVPKLFELGRTHKVALMIGGNTFDGSSLRYPAATIVAKTSPEVLKTYENENLSGDALGYAIHTDEHVNAPARWFAAAQSKRGAPAYHYVFSHVSSFRKNQPGAAHGEELPYVFNSWDRLPGLGNLLSEQDRRTTKIMHDCWVAFAKSGKPRCEGAPEWPAYKEDTGWTMELGATPQLRQHYRHAQFAAHDSVKNRNPQSTRDGLEVVEALRAAK
jgi:para-nitrobenzyl esterase